MTDLQSIVLGDDDELRESHDTPNDTWGVMIFVICKDLGDFAGGLSSLSHHLRFAFACVAMICNLCMQFALLWWTFEYAVTPTVATIQINYASFHKNCFDTAGNFIKSKWEEYPVHKKDALCQTVLSQPLFLFAILFLWTLAMLQEFRENFNLHRHIMMLIHLPYGVSTENQVVEKVDGDNVTEYHLVALHPGSR